MPTIVYHRQEIDLVASYRKQRRGLAPGSREYETLSQKECIIHGTAFERYTELAKLDPQARIKRYCEMFNSDESSARFLEQGIWHLPPFSQPVDTSAATADDPPLPTVGPPTTPVLKPTPQAPAATVTPPWAKPAPSAPAAPVPSPWGAPPVAAAPANPEAPPAGDGSPKPKRKAPAGAFKAAPAGAFK